jgi:hypothetical protein
MEEGKDGSKLFENCHRKDIVKEHVNKLGNLLFSSLLYEEIDSFVDN